MTSSTSANQETNRETVATKLALHTKAKRDVGIRVTEQNVTVSTLKMQKWQANENLSKKREKVVGKAGLQITSSVISGVKGYHLMLADQLIDVQTYLPVWK